LKKYQLIFAVISVLIVFRGCAKIGSPMGGPKDETPPGVVRSTPDNYSTRFVDKRIEIEFNEFIQLKNINQELVVSPPQKEKPVVRLRNKTMIIDLKEALLDSTTYTLNFGQAIADNNESNVLENYQFVFSTGNFVDSLGISGLILNAFDLKPSEEPVTIMIYDDFNDSIPYKEIPMYIGRSTKKGYFEINNVKSDTFKVFALKDKNYNLLYDLADEDIAFLDTTIILSAELIRSILDSIKISQDTVKGNSLIDDKTDNLVSPVKDTLLQDTLIQDTLTFPKREKYSISFELFLFHEDNKPQYMSGSARKNQKRMEFYFNRPLTDSLYIAPLNFSCDSNWFILEKNITGDTLIYWIRDSIIFKQDTLRMHLRYLVTDSVLNYIPYDDTVDLVFTKELTKSKKGQAAAKKKENLKLAAGIQQGATQDLFKGISVIPEYPVENINMSKLSLFKTEDTLEYSQAFALTHDSLYFRKYWINSDWEEIMNYRLFIEPGAFTDIYGLCNDTSDISFKTQSVDHYGRLILTLVNVDQDIIVQLLSEKDNVIGIRRQHESKPVEFPWLEPGKYKLKIIFDTNGNGKWDTGKYLSKLQPEKVQFYSGEVNIRENWDLELTWDLRNEEVLSR
jgi:hypothetical protein